MLDNFNALKLLDRELQEIISIGKFKLQEEIDQNTQDLVYDSELGTFKIEKQSNTLSLFCTNIEDPKEDDFSKKSSCLWQLDDEQFDEKTIKSVATEFSFAIENFFDLQLASTKATGANKQNAPKAKIKRKKQKGAQDYAPIDLALRLTNIYPETKSEIDKYIDENQIFYAELFMKEQISDKLKNSIKNKEQKTIKKLANAFNLYYEDGEKDTQSLIAVTLLMFNLYDDKEAFANIAEYLDSSIADIVKAGMKRLNSPAGKTDLKKYNNPKPYKEKKKSNFAGKLLDFEQPK
ncbi:MAG: hypothetical protein Q4E28_01095 [Clostridia bacterium]|nr:hypothetical protein [Clostridia bacterium]